MKMIRLSLLIFVLLVLPHSAEAQTPRKHPLIGFLASSSGERIQSRFAAFDQGLNELGYFNGKNITIEFRSAGGDFDRLPQLVSELVLLNPNLLVTEGAPAAHAAKRTTSTIPIVIGNAADPVGTGLVASLARPGGNITGLSDFNLAVVTKRVEIIKEVVPSASRVAVLWNPGNPTNPLQLKEIQAAASGLNVTVLRLAVKEAKDIDRAFGVMAKDHPGALVVLGDPMFGTHLKKIGDLATKNRIPAIYGSSDNLGTGGLMSYGTSFNDLYRRAAIYVDKILKGAKPADLPIEQPTKFELVINLKTAKQLGLTIPPNVLARADRVIK
jgi:putative tryptophan/tyrosine transport system substrate-binding protein